MKIALDICTQDKFLKRENASYSKMTNLLTYAAANLFTTKNAYLALIFDKWKKSFSTYI